jgi:hypothetical protein
MKGRQGRGVRQALRRVATAVQSTADPSGLLYLISSGQRCTPHLSENAPPPVRSSGEDRQIGTAAGLFGADRILLIAPAHCRHAPAERQSSCAGELLQIPIQLGYRGAGAVGWPPVRSDRVLSLDWQTSGRKQYGIGVERRKDAHSVVRKPAADILRPHCFNGARVCSRELPRAVYRRLTGELKYEDW